MNRVKIIAEAGVNHNGSLEMAKRLVDTATSCGADIVKFQTAQLEALVSDYAPMAEYQQNNTGEKMSQKEMLAKLLLSCQDFEELARYCREKGIEFLSTPFDIESIRFLEDKVGFWKVPSGEITNYPYLCEIARTGKDVVLSTGMSTMEEIKDAVGLLRERGSGGITLLHCTTEYPAPLDEINLMAMPMLAREFHCAVGYSDHTEGIEVSIAAAALGAAVIEKHFTLDKSLPGPDHRASASPEELACLVKGVRKIERAMGRAVKEPGKSEEKNRAAARKSIVAARKISRGEIFTEENLTTKRPGSGISPMEWNSVIGSAAARGFEKDELIKL